jgi:hypothetical protein
VTDHQLIDRMRCGDLKSWGAYEARFRPILEAYARRAKIPQLDWPVCLTEVLEDEGIRLTRREAIAPVSLAAHLIAAVHDRYLRLERANSCYERYHGVAGEFCSSGRVVTSRCSENASRDSDIPPAASTAALTKLLGDLRSGLTPEEEAMLVWLSEGVPHAQIAGWLGLSHDVCTKRIWRLRRRLRLELVSRAATYSSADQSEITRVMRRVSSNADNRRVAS